MLHHPDLHKTKYVEELKNFAIGGAAGIIATTAILPVDYIKVHIQIQAEGRSNSRISPLAFTREIYRTKGLLEFYSGLSSAILRQAVYATTRLGLYKTLIDREKAVTGTDAVSFTKKFMFSSFSGAVGAIVGNPCDIALIRVQTDHSLPVEQRRNYKGVFDALYRIPKEEGIYAYWRACTPTVLRACAMNFGMLAPYDQCKEFLDRSLGHTSMNRIYASFFAATCACIISLPFDNAKVKCQRMVPDVMGIYPYKNFADCCVKSLRKEGVLGFYAGFSVYVLRVGPNVIITLLTLDLLHHLFDSPS
jgi:solute carrier family 25 (mitochondrial oxoglutarate transporter), member 11